MNPTKTAVGSTNTPKKSQFLVLSAADLEEKEEDDLLRDYVKHNRIIFEFPDGLAKVPVLEECRALCDIENFDVMYDLMMQYLTGKTICIKMLDDDRKTTVLGQMYVQTKDDDLRQMDCVSEYPWLVYWLVEFMGGKLGKKFPRPGKAPASAAETKPKR